MKMILHALCISLVLLLFLSFDSRAECEGDIKNNGDVDGSDLAVLCIEFGATNCPDCESDLDDDDDVDRSDLEIFGDDFGRVNCSSVLDISPVAAFTASSTLGPAPLTVYFNAGFSSEGGSHLVSYTWDFGDGNIGTGLTTNHRFDFDGSYTVTLTVTGDDGRTDSATGIITVLTGGTPVGPLGGRVTSANGLVTLDIPADALSATVDINIIPVTQYPAGAVPKTVYQFGPEGITFAEPAQLIIQYEPLDLPANFDEGTLWLGKLVGDTGKTWQNVTGYVVDTAANTLSAMVDSFSTFGVGGLDMFSQISETAYVVDHPSPGSSNEFTELNEAVMYLTGVLEPWESGKVIIQTHRELVVQTLNFSRNIQVEVDSGYSPQISGPGAQPLVVNAAASVGLARLIVVNAGGMIINASAGVAINNNSLPALTVVLGSASPLPLSPASDPRQAGGTLYGNSWSFGGNTIVGPFKTLFNANLNGRVNMVNNNTLTLDVGGEGSIMEFAEISSNQISEDLSLSFGVGTGAFLNVKNHSTLNLIDLDMALFNNASVNLDGNVAVFSVFKLAGGESVTLGLSNNNFSQWEAILNLQDLTINGDRGEYGETTFTVNGGLGWNQSNGMIFSGDLNMTSGETSKVDLNFRGATDFQKNFILKLGGDGILRVNDNMQVGFFGWFQVSGNTGEFSVNNLGAGAGFFVDFLGVRATGTVNISNSQEKINQFLEVQGDVTTGSVNVQNVILGTGAYLSIQFNPGNFQAPTPTPGALLSDTHLLPATTSGVVISGVTASELTIGHSPFPITIEKSTILGRAPIFDSRSSVTVENTTIHDDLSFMAIDGQVDVTKNSLGGLRLNDATVNATNNQSISGEVLVHYEGRLNLIDNPYISGNVSIHNDGKLRVTGNTFAGTQMFDFNRDGGLLNEPVQSNSGLNPYNIYTWIDWNGNGCADYPPEDDQINPYTGKCNRDGVPPPTE